MIWLRKFESFTRMMKNAATGQEKRAISSIAK